MNEEEQQTKLPASRATPELCTRWQFVEVDMGKFIEGKGGTIKCSTTSKLIISLDCFRIYLCSRYGRRQGCVVLELGAIVDESQ